MAREAVRNEPSVSCSLKERGLSTARVAYLYVPLGVVVIRLFLCTSCTLFFSDFCISANYILAMGVYVKQWLLIVIFCMLVPFSYASVYNCHM